MINVYEEFKNQNLKSKMILQVHDELVFDVYKPELNEVKQIVKNKMEKLNSTRFIFDKLNVFQRK